jgi:hypothetical protein
VTPDDSLPEKVDSMARAAGCTVLVIQIRALPRELVCDVAATIDDRHVSRKAAIEALVVALRSSLENYESLLAALSR